MIQTNKLKIIFTFIIILVLIFLFMYDKSLKEFFYSTNKLEININRKNNILFLTDDLEKITQINKGTFLMKHNKIFKSNEDINRNFKYNGFVFKPNVNLKNIKIGLHNDNDKKEEMSFYFDIKENKTFNIKELDFDNNYSIQNIDLCLSTELKKCLRKKNVYTYHDNELLGIMIDNDKINYLSINKTLDSDNNVEYIGNIIHKSIHIPSYPLKVAVYNTKNDNLIDEAYWITNSYTADFIPNKWSVEVIEPSNYNKEELPPKESLSEDIEEVNNLEEEKEYSLENLEPWDKKIFITGSEFNSETNILKLGTKTNMTEDNIKYLKNVLVNIVLNIDGIERTLSIPYYEYQIKPNLTTMEIDISKYSNYLLNLGEFKSYLELVRSDTIQDKNIISNDTKIINIV